MLQVTDPDVLKPTHTLTKRPSTKYLRRLKKMFPDGDKKETIHLDVAINQLTLDMVQEKMQQEDLYATETLCKYYDEDGIPELKEAAAKYFTKYFRTSNPIAPDDLTFVTSVRGCMDVLGHCLANPGDVFIAFTPLYSRIPSDFGDRSEIEIWPAPLRSKEEGKSDSFALSVDKIKNAYEAAIEAKKTVKGIFLINPGNPIGDVMSPELLMEILQFAAKNNLHVIVDEIYALFVHEKDVSFRSVLSLPNLPDPQRTYMIYGLSKDFGLTAWRVGIIHTIDKSLNAKLQEIASSQCIPLPIMEAATRILNDHDWIDRLAEDIPKTANMQYRYACDRLVDMGFLIRHTPASFFIWVYMGSVMKEVTFEEEQLLAQDIEDKANLVIAPGKKHFASDPGWYRMIFTVKSEILVEAMDRLEKYIKERQKKS